MLWIFRYVMLYMYLDIGLWVIRISYYFQKFELQGSDNNVVVVMFIRSIDFEQVNYVVCVNFCVFRFSVVVILLFVFLLGFVFLFNRVCVYFVGIVMYQWIGFCSGILFKGKYFLYFKK